MEGGKPMNLFDLLSWILGLVTPEDVPSILLGPEADPNG